MSNLTPRFDIRAVMFDGDEVEIHYMHMPNDIRFRGALVARHTLTVSAEHEGWHNEIWDLKNAAYELLTDALDDFDNALPTPMEELFGDRDEDEEKGMGE